MVETRLILGDCLEAMPELEAGSINAIITDLPYGTTACAWDEIIPFEPLWAQVKRLLKPRGAFVTTASQPFTSRLIVSNIKWFKYEWIWNKETAGNFQLANKLPMKFHENIVVFSENGHTYNPQMTRRKKPIDKRNWRNDGKTSIHFDSKSRDISKRVLTEAYPKSIIDGFCSVSGECNNPQRVHPTQKPVALYEYLIKTYTNPGDIVLDCCMGSGTTGIAAVQTDRNFVGIEIDSDYFKVAEQRIKEAKLEFGLRLDLLPSTSPKSQINLF